jgi:hypothetical protein
MTESHGSRTGVPRAAQNASRGISAVLGRFGASRLAILALGGVAGVLMIVSDFLTLYHVDVVTAQCSDLASPNLRNACTTTGGGHHGYALAILGALVLVMTWGAAIGLSRPAGIALLVLGAAGLAIVLAIDTPDIHKTGIVGDQFSNAKATPGLGYPLEIAGAALALAAGGLAVGRSSRGAGGRKRSRRSEVRGRGAQA